MRPIRRAGLFAFRRPSEQRGVLAELAAQLRRAGVSCVGLGPGAAALRRLGFPGLKRAGGCRGLDALLSLGGDGTLLGAVAMAAPAGVPVLGVNLGQLGFMSAVNATSLALELPALLAGRGRLVMRGMLRAELRRRGRVFLSADALNDVVIARVGRSKLARLEASIDGRALAHFRADGLVVATPTGSTAYALAVGGPIVASDANVLLLAPIAPHTLSNRPLVVPGPSQLLLSLPDGAAGLALSADGGPPLRLRAGDSVALRRSPLSAGLIFPPSHDPWAVLRAKLGWQVPSYPSGA